ncbi:MAG: SPOCS domain-containing protein [Clostridia bacterium]
MECSYKEMEYSNVCFCESDNCFCDTSLIVPDSKNDIAKIINVKATACITNSKAEEGRIQISGTVKFNILYIGESDNVPLCAMEQTVPFSHVLMSENVTSDFVTVSSIGTVTPGFTLINSRKIKVNANIRLFAKAYRHNRINILTNAENAQTRTTDVTFDCAKVICKKNVSVISSADIPAGKNAISSILRHSERITDSEYKVLNNKTIIKGNILLSLLYLSDSEICECAISLPFTEVVEAEGLSPNYETQVKISIDDCDVSADTDLSGEYKMIDATTILSVSIVSFMKTSVPIVTDIYLPRGGIKTEKTAVTPSFTAEKTNEEEYIKENITINNLNFPQSRIVDLFIQPGSPTFENEDLSVVTIPIEVTVLYTLENSLNSHTAKIQATHKFSNPTTGNVTAELNHSSYTISGNNGIEVRLSLNLSASSFNQNQIQVYSFCEEMPYTMPKRASVIISFVRAGDTLWDIAKAYNIPLSDLAMANALKEDAILTVGQKLLIPR